MEYSNEEWLNQDRFILNEMILERAFVCYLESLKCEYPASESNNYC